MTDPSHPTGTGPTISESTIPNILPRPERRGFPPGPYWDWPPSDSEVMIIHDLDHSWVRSWSFAARPAGPRDPCRATGSGLVQRLGALRQGSEADGSWRTKQSNGT